jgi:hypothetical protein
LDTGLAQQAELSKENRKTVMLMAGNSLFGILPLPSLGSPSVAGSPVSSFLDIMPA